MFTMHESRLHADSKNNAEMSSAVQLSQDLIIQRINSSTMTAQFNTRDWYSGLHTFNLIVSKSNQISGS